MSNKPAVEFKSSIAGGLKLTGWQKERGLSWQLSKSYKDKESGDWKESKSLTDWDLDAIVSLVAQAKEHKAKQRLEEKYGSKEGASPVAPDPVGLAAVAAKMDLADDDIPF